MKVYLDIIGSDYFEEVPWPGGVRLPCIGETYLVGADTYRVQDVQWETEQGIGEAPSVQIRVGSAD